MSDKQTVLQTIQGMPDDVDFKTMAEEINIMAGIERGLKDIHAGRTKSHEEVKQMFGGWIKEWNTK